MTVQRVLDLNFQGETGKNHHLKVYAAREDVTATQLGLVMDTIITQDVFSGPAGKLTEKDGAKLVVTETTEFNPL